MPACLRPQAALPTPACLPLQAALLTPACLPLPASLLMPACLPLRAALPTRVCLLLRAALLTPACLPLQAPHRRTPVCRLRLLNESRGACPWTGPEFFSVLCQPLPENHGSPAISSSSLWN